MVVNHRFSVCCPLAPPLSGLLTKPIELLGRNLRRIATLVLIVLNLGRSNSLALIGPYRC